MTADKRADNAQTPVPTPELLRRQWSLGGMLGRAWVGYRRRLDAALAAAGFDDQRMPDGRILRMCVGVPHVTTAQIGRELGITRQGASKIVASLRTRGYVTLEPSPTNGREKIVKPTHRAHDLLDAHRNAARATETALRSEIGAEAFDALGRLLSALGGTDQPRMRDYLRQAADLDAFDLTEPGAGCLYPSGRSAEAAQRKGELPDTT